MLSSVTSPAIRRRFVLALGEAATRHDADLAVFPELAVCGYPPEDLLFHSGLQRQIGPALTEIGQAAQAAGIAAIVGYPEFTGENIFNAALLFDGDGGRSTIASAVCPITASSTRSAISRPEMPPS